MLQERETIGKEVSQGRDQLSEARIRVLERENINLKECISSKDSSIGILKEKLQEKSEQLIDADGKLSAISS